MTAVKLPCESRLRNNLKGRKFGKLTVLELVGFTASRNSIWKTQCDCGVVKNVIGNAMTSGNTVSCGCYAANAARQRAFKHGNFQSGNKRSPEYVSWQSMKMRCLKPDHDSYEYYGARGIRVCERWLHDFSAFLADMGPKPSPKHTIDRKDVNKDYCPENCEWAGVIEQQNNKRNTVKIAYQGRELTLRQCSEITGISANTLKERIRRGYTDEQVMSKPLGRCRIEAIVQPTDEQILKALGVK